MMHSYKQHFKKLSDAFIHNIRVILPNSRYKKTLGRLKSKSDPIQVCFLVSENQKWNCDSLYKALSADPRFSPFIAITKLAKDSTQVFDNNIDFFKTRNYQTKIAFDINKKCAISLAELNADIVFYQQPWGLHKKHKVQNVAKFALTCYIPYGLMVANNDYNHYGKFFQKALWRYFAPNTIIKELFLENSILTPPSKIVVSGHPKMDVYNDNSIEISRSHKKRIIYAPHHSITDDTTLRYGTFSWNGVELLEFARRSQNIDWVFKPHPGLKDMLEVKNILSKEEVENYYQAWNDLENCTIHDSGDYFDEFKNSDALITDCGSFLAEYLPTEKPIILLVNPKSEGYNKFGSVLVDQYYKARTYDELETLINKVIIEEQDDRKVDRLEMMNNIEMKCGKSGDFIVQYLSDILKN